jgi:Domain of unknown function (DUF4292)
MKNCLLFVIIAFFACNSSKKTTTATPTPSKTTTSTAPTTTSKPAPPKVLPPKVLSPKEIILSKINTPKYLNGTASISVEGGTVPSVTLAAQFNLQKDSGIVVSVSKFGFEVGRVLLRPDSVYIVNRINSNYYVRDYKFVEKELQFPLTYQDLQSFLTGAPSFVGSLQQERLTTEAQEYRLSGTKKQVKMEFLFDKATVLLKNIAAIDTSKEKQSLNMKYEAYKKLNNQSDFSYTRNIQIKSPSTGNASVDIQFEKVEADVPKPLRFDIPTRYTRH